jgi:hypothetical protein
MNQLNWTADGLGIVALTFAAVSAWLFQKKYFGLFDPLLVFLVTRIAPTIAALLILASSEALTSSFYLLALISTLLFIITLYKCTPKINRSSPINNSEDFRRILSFSVFLCLLKLGILATSTGSLPVFGDKGSDSFIDFALENKLSTSFIFAIASSELVLLSFVLPFVKGKEKALVVLLGIISILMHLTAGKKSSLLSVMLALSLGDYLRAHYTSCSFKVFTKKSVIITLLIFSILWAGWIYKETALSIDYSFALVDYIFGALDLIFIQWSYPTFLFSSGELSGFFDSYIVNRFIYFFHTALSPIGLPAFSASIGPALNEYQTGELTGNGVNPTFLIEGYVLFGMLLPFYSILTAFLVGKIRYKLSSLKSPRRAVILHALLLPPIYILPADALLFMKIVMAMLLLSPVLIYISRKKWPWIKIS